MNSIFATSSALQSRPMCLRRTIGVFPMVSRIESWIRDEVAEAAEAVSVARFTIRS
jgi:hypothetical protein